MCEYLKALQKPFPAEDIEWRVSHAVKTRNGCSALVLAYVTNRAIQERLDEVFGIAGWKNEYREWREKGVLCTITCKVDGEWIFKADGADETDMESTKGGFSASMKRAAVQWGIGRYLYNLDQTWVDIKERGKHYISTSVKVGQGKEFVKGYWDTPKLPNWALPENYQPKESAALHPEVEEPLDIPDEDLAAIANDSKQNTSAAYTPKSGAKANSPITEGQTKMFWVRAKQAGLSEKKEELWELLSAHLNRVVSSTENIEKTEFNSILKWFEEKMAAIPV